MYHYAYAVGTLFFIAIWVALFVLFPRCRQAIFWTSLVFAPAGPVSAFWNNQDYWYPRYLIEITIGRWHFGIEDYLLAFAFAGISAGVFEILAIRKGFSEAPRVAVKTLFRMIGFGIVAFFVTAFWISIVRLNSIYGLMLAGVVSFFLLMFLGKWKLLPLVFFNAVIFCFFFGLYYVLFLIPIFPGVITALWDLKAASGIMLLGVPIEEPLTAFTTALLFGPVFRVCSLRRF